MPLRENAQPDRAGLRDWLIWMRARGSRHHQPTRWRAAGVEPAISCGYSIVHAGRARNRRPGFRAHSSWYGSLPHPSTSSAPFLQVGWCLATLGFAPSLVGDRAGGHARTEWMGGGLGHSSKVKIQACAEYGGKEAPHRREGGR